MKTSHRLVLLLASLLLAACAGRTVQQVPALTPDQAAAASRDRAAMDQWTLTGRVALSNGRQGGSGRLDWVQAGNRYAITLSGPVTRQGWRLSGDSQWARLEGVEGGPHESADVEDLLFVLTGWEIPVRAMVEWVRALPADERLHGQARTVAAANGLPASLEQAGWQVSFRDWQAAGPGQPLLPRRIEATRAQTRVRLLVDDWQLTSP